MGNACAQRFGDKEEVDNIKTRKTIYLSSERCDHKNNPSGGYSEGLSK